MLQIRDQVVYFILLYYYYYYYYYYYFAFNFALQQCLCERVSM
jgi:hypothetical protein